MRELHDDLTGRVRARAELRKIHRVDPPRPNAAEARRDAVHLAPDAEAGGRGQERQRGDDQTEPGAQHAEPEEIGRRRGGEKDRADEIGEPWWSTVLDRAFADPRLEHFEVEKTRQAVTAAEREADRQLGADDPENRPPTG